jgi:hypothetical protein
MIDASNQNYSETLSQISELYDLVDEFEKKFYSQLPQGISNEITSTKEAFLNWIEEAEFTLQNYKI